MIILKSEREQEQMRAACAVAASVLDDVATFIAPGQTTRQIDEHAAACIKRYGGRSAFLGYRRYPCHACISVNEQVVHGLASDRRVQFGDIISLDVGVIYHGFIGDNARTVAVGGCDLQAQKLIDVTEKALYEGISQAVAGNRVVDISRAIQTYVEGNGFSVVREFVGHGVGRSMHEDPQIPNFGTPGEGIELREGMVMALEPMVNAGTWRTTIAPNKWTVLTADGSLSAHFEHTIAITNGEADVLTVL